VTSGALPSGLSLSSAGPVSGTPTVTGTFNFTVTATAANGCAGSRAYALTVSTFTDDPLVAGTSVIRAVHITELRTRIDALWTRYGLSPPFGWTDPSLTAGITVRAVHLSDLRTALQAAYTAAGPSAPALPFTDSPIVTGFTFIRAVQIQELRDAVIALEGF
jgi:hypothetical protein